MVSPRFIKAGEKLNRVEIGSASGGSAEAGNRSTVSKTEPGQSEDRRIATDIGRETNCSRVDPVACRLRGVGTAAKPQTSVQIGSCVKVLNVIDRPAPQQNESSSSRRKIAKDIALVCVGSASMKFRKDLIATCDVVIDSRRVGLVVIRRWII